MAVLSCPQCKEEMVEKRSDGISREECAPCSALWIDYYSLEAWISSRLSVEYKPELGREASRLTAELLNPWSSNETPLSCPRCPTHLLAAKTDEVSIKWCQTCRGIFMESSALKKIEASNIEKLQAKKGLIVWLEEGWRQDWSSIFRPFPFALLVAMIVLGVIILYLFLLVLL